MSYITNVKAGIKDMDNMQTFFLKRLFVIFVRNK